jgi:two-component system OmpR family sensor kinase
MLAASANFAGAVPGLDELGGTEAALEGTPLDVAVGDTTLRGVLLLVPGRAEYLLYAASQRTIDDDTQYLWRLLLGLFVCATLAASLLARWVGERLARDVHAIAGVARAVAEGNLDARVLAGAQGSDETRALAADLDHMISQLGELVRSQRTFISHAAHELRSPLATLLGELQLALRRPREAQAYRAALEEMRADVEMLVRLTEDLLLLARLQAGAAPVPNPTRVDVAVAEAVRMAHGRAAQRGVRVVTAGLDVAGDARVSAVRGGELARLLRNLIDNAITHSPPGGEVRVDLRRDRRLNIAVTDAGPGVAAEDRPHIFAPFYRAARETPDHPAGAGLGLSIARAIAQGIGGELVLDETYTAGARFLVSLPLTGPAAA